MSNPSSSSKLILFRYLHHHHRSSISSSSTPISRFTNPSISSPPYSSVSSKSNSWVGLFPRPNMPPSSKPNLDTILTTPRSSISSKLNSWVGSNPNLFQNPSRKMSTEANLARPRSSVSSKLNSWVGSKPGLYQNPCRNLSKSSSWVGSKPGLLQNPCRKMSTEANLARPRSSVSSNLNSWVGSKPGLLQNPCRKVLTETNLTRNLMGLRYVSTKGKNLGSKLDAGLLKGRIKEPVLNAFVKYKQAVGLQMDAFWKRNSLVLVGAGGVLVCILLWRVMFGIANTFVGLSEGMAKYGFLALSSAIVAFAGLYLRSRFTINPDKVYRMAMRKLNTSADILEIMGAPLTGTDLRAYVMSGGGITLKNFKAGLRSKRCFLIFPIRGAEMKGLVSVEVKNKRGQYDMKLLSVDLPMATGPDQRLFLIGDEEEYRVGGGLISELRDPVVKAMAAAKEFEARDIEEDKEDARRELEDAERQHREEVEKIQREGS